MMLLLTAKEYTEQTISPIPCRLYGVEHFCCSEQIIPRMLIQSKDFLTDYNISKVPKKLYRAEIFCYSVFIEIKINVKISKIKIRKELASIFFCNFYFDKACQLAQTTTSPKAMTTNKTETKFIFPSRSHNSSLRLILSHLVIPSKHERLDLRLIFTA